MVHLFSSTPAYCIMITNQADSNCPAHNCYEWAGAWSTLTGGPTCDADDFHCHTAAGSSSCAQCAECFRWGVDTVGVQYRECLDIRCSADIEAHFFGATGVCFDLSSDAGLWERDGATLIRPDTADVCVVKKGAGTPTLGISTCRWNSGFFNQVNICTAGPSTALITCNNSSNTYTAGICAGGDTYPALLVRGYESVTGHVISPDICGTSSVEGGFVCSTGDIEATGGTGVLTVNNINVGGSCNCPLFISGDSKFDAGTIQYDPGTPADPTGCILCASDSSGTLVYVAPPSGTALWSNTTGEIQPCVSGCDIVPNGTACVGQTADKWAGGYFTNFYPDILEVTTCAAIATSPAAGTELLVGGDTCTTGILKAGTCACSPIVIGSTCVCGPRVFGSTCVCSPLLCGTSIIGTCAEFTCVGIGITPVGGVELTVAGPSTMGFIDAQCIFPVTTDIYCLGANTCLWCKAYANCFIGCIYAGTCDCVTIGGNILCLTGNVVLNAGTKAATIEYEPQKFAVLKVDESPDVIFNDHGTAQVLSGKPCYIEFDCIFQKVTENGTNYNLQLTPQSSYFWNVHKKENGFILKSEKDNNFDWHVRKIRKGYKNDRWLKEGKPFNLFDFELDDMNTFESYVIQNEWGN